MTLKTNPKLAGVIPYDPAAHAVPYQLSANENAYGMPDTVRFQVEQALKTSVFNRYPDPLANDLRDEIASSFGVGREQVLVGNGGDELLFDIALAWGGAERIFLNFPPTFSVYAGACEILGTAVENIARTQAFDIDVDAACTRLASGDIDYTIVTTPNNPTGNLTTRADIIRMLEASDALVVVDEAYMEFAQLSADPATEPSVADLIARYDNLLILRTLSKAYGCAGVRLGYVVGSEKAITELIKVRQPYSVDTLSQTIARVVWSHREAFVPIVESLVHERERVIGTLSIIDNVRPYASQANFILVRMNADAHAVWEYMHRHGVLVRNVSDGGLLKNCLRITVGTPTENAHMIEVLIQAISEIRGRK